MLCLIKWEGWSYRQVQKHTCRSLFLSFISQYSCTLIIPNPFLFRVVQAKTVYFYACGPYCVKNFIGLFHRHLFTSPLTYRVARDWHISLLRKTEISSNPRRFNAMNPARSFQLISFLRRWKSRLWIRMASTTVGNDVSTFLEDVF